MNNSESLIKHLVNMDVGYSQSDGWMGFFERNGTQKEENIDFSVNLFFQYFENELCDCEIVFRLTFYSSMKKLYSSYKLDEINRLLLNRLTENNLIKFNAKHEQAFSTIKLSNCNYSNARDLIVSIMSIGDFIGRVFIVLPRSELILYPHEDIGFGIISTSKYQENATGLKFLKLASNNIKFNAYNGGRSESNKIKPETGT